MSRSQWGFVPLQVLLIALLSGPLKAQGRQATAVPLDASESIVLDGNLDEAIWQRVPPIGSLGQVRPIEGAEATEPTDFRICYDADYLYIGYICSESTGQIFDKQMGRDDFIRYDDVVEWWFDTFEDERFAYWFQVSAGGSRGDALISDNGESFNKSWDGIWDGRVRVDATSWQVEAKIPFKTLAFDPSSSSWGFNVVRKRKLNDEDDRWANPSTGHSFFRLSEGGTLAGLRGLSQGLGLDVTPYVKSAWRDEQDGDHLEGDAGLDLSYRITPSLNLRLTVNTDFAETEVDSRQFNLDRFPLFFPEKRDFFLEDSGLFEFNATFDPIPFFSRTIGRSGNGEPIPILAGAKLSGRVGEWNLGALVTRLDDSKDVDGTTLGTVRVSRNLGGGNSLGLLATGGNPLEPESAMTLGADLRLGGDDFFGPGKIGNLWAWWLGSQLEGPGGDSNAYGVRAEYESSNWDHLLGVRVVGEEFDPKLGFVRRSGIRLYEWASEYVYRTNDGGFLREAKWQLEPELITDLDGTLETLRVAFDWLNLEFATNDGLSIETTRIQDRVLEPFSLTDTVGVDADEYWMTRHEISLEASDRRVISGDINFEWGDYFGGQIRRTEIEPAWVPSKHFTLTAGWEHIDVEVDSGSFDVDLASLGLDFTFNPRLTWRNLAQFDTESDELGVQTRLRWIIEPGRELFLVALVGWQDPTEDGSLVPLTQEATLKIAYTFRF